MEKSLKDSRWEDLTESQPLTTKTLIEKPSLSLNDVIISWNRSGVLNLDFSMNSEFIDLIDRYCDARERLPKYETERSNYWHGWHYPTSYLNCMPMLDLGLYSSLMEVINFLLNESGLLHLALTGWVSTQRNWHQDSYLNPPNVWSHYLAAWIALEDIHPDSGPFEYVPGSHKWEVLRREKLFKTIPLEISRNDNWPSITEDEISRICEEKIMDEAVEPIRFLPKKGEVLLWHSNLIHRGTIPKNEEMLRKALILHYSGVTHRPDMDPIKRFGSGFYYDGPTNGSTRMKK